MRRSGSTGAGARPCASGAQWNHSATLSTARVHSPPAATGASGASGARGLEPVDRRILAEQAVAVVLANVVPHEFAQAEQRIELRKLADERIDERHRVARRGVVIGGGQAVGVLEVARSHAEAPGVLVHHLREGGL